MHDKPAPTNLEAQDWVTDKEEGGEAVVRAILDKTASDHYVDEIGCSVAAANPGYSPKSSVALISFKGQLRSMTGDRWQEWLASPTFEAHAAQFCAEWSLNRIPYYAYPADRLELVWRYDGDAAFDEHGAEVHNAIHD